MKKILKIISSVKGAESKSTQLADAVIEKLTAQYPGTSVKVKDLSREPYPHFHEGHLKVYRGMGEVAQEAVAEVEKVSDEAINELMSADIIVIGVPIYNFNIPSTLKAWLDHVMRAGKTFSYASGQKEGLVTNKKVYLAVSSGAIYSEGPMQAYNFAVPYLEASLGFIGITDISTFWAEGCDMPGYKETALQKAIERVAV
ncbi:NAD(P)H-dependent oxidoreductase [Chitinophaga filiformis]|uniref:FMN-dependent NADH-azoreductase n=1 Tax=Chitinophaga filiformis TaxID=104663 RepID=UPI001F2CE319|nr:NAD(P)H-dependent oxidoreductase [Chitinophaga filiformis]MCF6405718.1 NAD(P)H-dependent oxidoreductase [Chitinophaga filiformis]